MVSWVMPYHVYASRELSFSVDIELVCRGGYLQYRATLDGDSWVI